MDNPEITTLSPNTIQKSKNDLYVMQLLGSPVTASAKQEPSKDKIRSSSFTRRYGVGSPRKRPLSANGNIYNL